MADNLLAHWNILAGRYFPAVAAREPGVARVTRMLILGQSRINSVGSSDGGAGLILRHFLRCLSAPLKAEAWLLLKTRGNFPRANAPLGENSR